MVKNRVTFEFFCRFFVEAAGGLWMGLSFEDSDCKALLFSETVGLEVREGWKRQYDIVLCAPPPPQSLLGEGEADDLARVVTSWWTAKSGVA